MPVTSDTRCYPLLYQARRLSDVAAAFPRVSDDARWRGVRVPGAEETQRIDRARLLDARRSLREVDRNNGR